MHSDIVINFHLSKIMNYIIVHAKFYLFDKIQQSKTKMQLTKYVLGRFY